jgi:hypothetical protein
MANNKAAIMATKANPSETIISFLKKNYGIFKSDPKSIKESADEIIRCVTSSDLFLENDSAFAGSIICDIFAMRDVCLVMSKFYHITRKGGAYED